MGFIFVILVIAQVFYLINAARILLEPNINYNIVPSRLSREEKAPSATEIVKCIFVMKHDPQKMKLFEDKVIKLSTPSTPEYGNFLKPEDILRGVAPSIDSVEVVTSFLTSYGLSLGKNFRVSRYRDLIHVSMPLGIAASMLETEFGTFRSNVNSKIQLLRITKPYSLPEEIASVVNLVDDLVRLR